MKKRIVTTVQGRGSRITSPPHQLGIELGGADHVAKQVKSSEKAAKKLLKVRGV